jgi:hypothetical protein
MISNGKTAEFDGLGRVERRAAARLARDGMEAHWIWFSRLRGSMARPLFTTDYLFSIMTVDLSTENYYGHGFLSNTCAHCHGPCFA